MAKVAIMTDSNSGITQAEGKELGIKVIPMPFNIDGEEYVIDKIADSIDHYVECFNLKGLTTRLQDVA